jgi:hypothetical protein
VEGWEHDRAGTLLYPKAWCTDLEVPSDHVAAILGRGRARWQIEQEPCNVHKHQGDELEHHSGHGTQTWSRVLYRLNLLAFLAQAIVERGDRVSQRCVATTARREWWQTLRPALRLVLGHAWADLLWRYLDDPGPSP